MSLNWYRYASPGKFYPVASKMIPWFATAAAILLIIGLYVGLFLAPRDFQQGEAYRVLFIHVPAAWMGMLLYILMAIYAGIGWAFNGGRVSWMRPSLSFPGAMCTFFS